MVNHRQARQAWRQRRRYVLESSSLIKFMQHIIACRLQPSPALEIKALELKALFMRLV